MAISPFDYTSGNGFGQGLQLAGLQQQVQLQKDAVDLAQQQRQSQQQFQKDWQAAYSSGDPEQLNTLVAKYPGQIEAIKGAIGFRDDQHRVALGNTARDLRIAIQSGNPQAIAAAAQKNAGTLATVGSSPEEVLAQFQQDPQNLLHTIDTVGMGALGVKDYYDFQDKAAGRQVTMRGQDLTAETARRGQDITARGQDISAATTRRGQDQSMQRYNQTAGQAGSRAVQLSDGRTVNVSGKLHGAGANAFYEGVDNDGNVVRVPASSIAAPATSATNAQNFTMKKDLDALSGADEDSLGFLTGLTGGNGSPAIGSDYRSRFTGKEQRQLYTAAQRVQGRMQNQGIAAARDMGASGINTVAEAKMYFQGMPQIDFSSPGSLKSSIDDIKSYTNNYNQQYNVNVGPKPNSQTLPANSGASYTSKSGIQFKVE